MHWGNRCTEAHAECGENCISLRMAAAMCCGMPMCCHGLSCANASVDAAAAPATKHVHGVLNAEHNTTDAICVDT